MNAGFMDRIFEKLLLRETKLYVSIIFSQAMKEILNLYKNLSFLCYQT